MKSTINGGIGWDRPSHRSSRGSRIHVLRDGPHGMTLSDLNGKLSTRLNERHDEWSMRETASSLSARHADLMPEIVWNIKHLLGLHLHVNHKVNDITAAGRPIPRLGIKRPKHTLI